MHREHGEGLMGKLRVDQIRGLLPELEELRPLVDGLLSDSISDPERRWTTSGELGTLGHRLVRPDRIEARIPEMVRNSTDWVESIYGAVARAISALAEDDDEGAVAHFLDAADREEKAHRLHQSEAYALAAHKVARKLRNRAPALRALLQAARAARGQGKLEEASRRYEEVHDLATLIGEPVEGSTGAIGRGNVGVDRGMWQEAKQWYERALKLLGTELRSAHWHVYLNLSIVHRSTGEFSSCAEWLSRAEGVAAELGDADAGPILGNARGQLLLASRAWEDAERVLRSALDAATDVQARIAIGVNLGEALLARGRALEAVEVAREAERTAIVFNVLHRLPEIYRLLGAIAGERGVEDGFVFFEQALEIVRERNLPDFEAAQTLEAYGKFLVQGGKRAEARSRLDGAAEIYEKLGSRHLGGTVLALKEAIERGEASASLPEGRP